MRVSKGRYESGVSERKPISGKLRFEVFKRDSFTCQYCGRRSPEVTLHVDHIKPVAKKGDNDILNLITSCSECNLGKGARELDDNSVLSRQRAQLDELNERRAQLEMMIDWRNGLLELENDKVKAIVNNINGHLAPSCKVSESGVGTVREWAKRFEIGTLLQAIEEASVKIKRDKDGEATEESLTEFFECVGRYACVIEKSEGDDTARKLYYIRGILRNRCPRIPEPYLVIEHLNNLVANGADIGHMVDVAKRTNSYRRFIRRVEESLS